MLCAILNNPPVVLVVKRGEENEVRRPRNQTDWINQRRRLKLGHRGRLSDGNDLSNTGSTLCITNQILTYEKPLRGDGRTSTVLRSVSFRSCSSMGGTEGELCQPLVEAIP